MRLIGSLNNQDQAQAFQNYCRSRRVDLFLDKAGGAVQLWTIHEEDALETQKLFERFVKDPQAPEFFVLSHSTPAQTGDKNPGFSTVQKNPRIPFLTWLWILVSTVCFFIQMGQEAAVIKDRGSMTSEVMFTPIEEALFFDMPECIVELKAFVLEHGIVNEGDLKKLSPEDLQTWIRLKQSPYFHGFLDMVDTPSYREDYQEGVIGLAKKIREGEIYRLITPVFLHGSIIHIVFNMIWLFVLMKQIEMKLGVIKTVCLALSLALISNIAQYLVSGPFFLGVSGVVVGLAAFIWMRQKKAPWEGYLLSKSLIFFLMIYVLSLVVLSIGVFMFNLASHKNLAFGIANSAHVVGGLGGLFLGSCLLFRRP